MDSASESLYRQYSNKRPGLRLVSVEPAALPVTFVSTTVLAQEKKPLPLLEEFVVRSIAKGFASTLEIAAVLGLDEKLIANTFADLAAAGALQYQQSTKMGRLTPAGIELSRDLAAVTPVERTFKVHLDRTTWKVADYPRADLVKKSLAIDEGRILLPAKSTKQIAPDDIGPRELNRILGSDDRRSSSMEVLRVLRAKASEYWYLRCWILVYATGQGSALPEIAVVIDGASSADHDIAIEEAGGSRIFDLQIEPGESEPLPPLPDDLLEALTISATETSIEQATAQDAGGVVVRSLDMYEHRLVLQEALSTSRKRLLLVSPWVKSAVVNTQFLTSLEGAARRGVEVDIVHGYGPNDDGSDERALRQLKNLHDRFPARVRIHRHPNTHAKILIFDDVWIATSFNWLSFRGDAERTYRMEEGVLVRSQVHAEREYAQYIERLADQ